MSITVEVVNLQAMAARRPSHAGGHAEPHHGTEADLLGCWAARHPPRRPDGEAKKSRKSKVDRFYSAIFNRLNVYIYLYIYLNMYIYIYMCVYIYMYKRVLYIYEYIYIYRNICIYVHILYVHVCMDLRR